MTESKKDLHQEIVFFDGVCHLCNSFVDFVIQNETPGTHLRFAPLQGETAQRYLPESDRKSLSSVIFWQNGQSHRESEAVLQIAQKLRLPWRLFAFPLRLVPRSLRDSIYRFLARHRYTFFGKRSTCRLPSSEEKTQLLP